MIVIRYCLPALISISPLTLNAQSIAADNVNGYFAPVEVIEGHPQCNGVGKTTFELILAAEDLQFRLQGEHPRDVAFAGGSWTLPHTGQRCYVTERAGAEVTRVEIPCGDRQPPSGTALAMQGQSMQLDISGVVTLCQSLTDTHMLDGDWSADFTIDGITTTYEGQYAGSIEEYCTTKDNADTAVAALLYSQSGMVGDTWDVTERGDSAYELRLRSLRVDDGSGEENVITLSTDALFYTTVDDQAFCHDEICGLNHDRSNWRQVPIGLDYQVCQ